MAIKTLATTRKANMFTRLEEGVRTYTVDDYFNYRQKHFNTLKEARAFFKKVR